MFPVRTICPPLEQRVPKDNFVSFSALLFSGVTMFLQRGPHRQRQPHIKAEDFHQKPVAGTVLLCVWSPLQGECLCQGLAGSAGGRGALSGWLGHGGPDGTQESWISNSNIISSSLHTNVHLLLASLLQPLLICFYSDHTFLTFHYSLWCGTGKVPLFYFSLCALIGTRCPF